MRIDDDPVVAILAHPDDVKCVLGHLLRAMAAGSTASLILVTRGEGLTSAALSGVDPWQMGELRLAELRRFLDQVGIGQQNLHLIGVPDGSQTLPAMRDDFYAAVGYPFVDPLLGVDHVPYEDAVQPGMPFFGEALVETLVGLLDRLQPSIVHTHHPYDDHADHRAVSFFARKACARARTKPSIYATLVYWRRIQWPPLGETFYSEEIAAAFPGLTAQRLLLTRGEYALKCQASQLFVPTLSAAYIESNMKRDEVVWRL